MLTEERQTKPKKKKGEKKNPFSPMLNILGGN